LAIALTVVYALTTTLLLDWRGSLKASFYHARQEESSDLNACAAAPDPRRAFIATCADSDSDSRNHENKEVYNAKISVSASWLEQMNWKEPSMSKPRSTILSNNHIPKAAPPKVQESAVPLSLPSNAAAASQSVPMKLPTIADCGLLRCRYRYLNGSTAFNMPFGEDETGGEEEVPLCSDLLFEGLKR
jgi:hypothetical protein